MSHEIKLDSLKHHISKMRMPSPVTSVSPVSGKLGLTPVSHILNTGDLGLKGSASISPATLHREAVGLLMQLSVLNVI